MSLVQEGGHRVPGQRLGLDVDVRMTAVGALSGSSDDADGKRLPRRATEAECRRGALT
ncbi:hypothetical protein AB0N06_30795 [Streptomyces sp. NPDC051020]|uniref:hypothetical protein n=1 Tax=Streptomyces sp. NPDC051020 TaxID=3155409 RepID=UPI00343B0FF5